MQMTAKYKLRLPLCPEHHWNGRRWAGPRIAAAVTAATCSRTPASAANSSMTSAWMRVESMSNTAADGNEARIGHAGGAGLR